MSNEIVAGGEWVVLHLEGGIEHNFYHILRSYESSTHLEMTWDRPRKDLEMTWNVTLTNRNEP